MSEQLTPHFFKTPDGKSLSQHSIAQNFSQRQDLSPSSPINPHLDQEIRIRVARD